MPSIGCGSYELVRKGVYEVRWRENGKAFKRLLEKTPDEIKEFLQTRKGEMRDQKLGLTTAPSWDFALERFEEHQRAKGAQEVYIKDALTVLQGLREQQEDLGLFTPMHAQRHFDQRKAEGVSGRTVNREIREAYTFFRFCVRTLRAMNFNPLDGIDRYSFEEPVDRDLDKDEYRAVRAVSEPSVQDLMDFQLLTGVRISELQKMTWEQVDFKQRTWTILKRKNKRPIVHHLSDSLIAILMRQRRPNLDGNQVWRRWVQPIKNPKTAGPRKFVAGVAIRKEWYDNVLKNRCEIAGVKKFTSHALRHAAGDWARKAGAIVGDIQMLLGHSSIQTTEKVYAKGGRVERERAAQVLEAVWQNAISVKKTGTQG